MPGDGTPVFVPMNMGDGTYTVRVMQNTSGNDYVELPSTSVPVHLGPGSSPFLHPNLYCDFDENSASTRRARELTSGADNQAAALRAICDFIANKHLLRHRQRPRSSRRPPATSPTGRHALERQRHLLRLRLPGRGHAAQRRHPAQIVTGFTSRPMTSTTPGSWSTSTGPGTPSSSRSTPRRGRAST